MEGGRNLDPSGTNGGSLWGGGKPMRKNPVVRLQLMTGEMVFDLLLSALAVEYARGRGFMRPYADFRLFLDGEEVGPIAPPGPHREIDPRLSREDKQ